MHLQQENYLGTTKSKSGRGFDLRIFFILSSALNKSVSCSTTKRKLSLTSCIRLTNLQKVKAVTRNSYTKRCQDLYAEVRDMHSNHCETNRQKSNEQMMIPFHSLFLNFGTPLKRVSWTDSRSWTWAVCTSHCCSWELGFLVFCFTDKEERNKFNRLETKL